MIKTERSILQSIRPVQHTGKRSSFHLILHSWRYFTFLKWQCKTQLATKQNSWSFGQSHYVSNATCWMY